MAQAVLLVQETEIDQFNDFISGNALEVASFLPCADGEKFAALVSCLSSNNAGLCEQWKIAATR